MFLPIVLTVIGALVGALAGGPVLALIAGIAAYFLSRQIPSVAQPSGDPESRPDELNELRTEVHRLREEVEYLTLRLDLLVNANSQATEANQDTGTVQASVEVLPEAPPDLALEMPLADMAAKAESISGPIAPTFAKAIDSDAETARQAEPPDSLPAENEPSPAKMRETQYEQPTPVDALPGFDLLAAAKRWLLGGNTLVRVGVVILFFGLAFLVKFAAEHAVLPVEARYIGIGIGALVALVLGWRLRQQRPGYAMALQGLAVASLYLATFAAFRLHGLLPGSATFALLTAICGLSAALAVLQDARSLAVIGICGGFLSPILASTGGGSHVALFSYYALLNAGILGIAWFKAWRPLNVLGFFFTFGVASLWGSRNYHDEMFASTEPFLIGFFLLYLAISLLYARRRQAEAASPAIRIAGERIDYVDGTLVFGNPLAAFGLQYLMVKDMAFGSAFSALGMGLIYLPVATFLYRRHREDFRLMVESFLALGVIFASLAIPLGLDAKWTSAAWAVEGAGIFWIGLRQQRPVARAFSLLLQTGSAISLLLSLKPGDTENLFGLIPVFDGSALSPVLVGAALLFTSRAMTKHPQPLRPWEADIKPLVLLAGLALCNLAFPMFLDLGWTGLAWALVGAGITWFAAGHGILVAMLFGGMLQLLGGLGFVSSVPFETAVPLLNRFWLGSVAIALAGLLSGWRVQRSESDLASTATLGLVWGLAWWCGAGLMQIDRHVGYPLALASNIGFLAMTALLASHAGRIATWRAAEKASLLLLPALAIGAGLAVFEQAHPAEHGGWLAWPLALFALWHSLRRTERHGVTNWLTGTHVLGFWLTLALTSWQCGWTLDELAEVHSAWAVLGWMLVPIATLAVLSGSWARHRWPLVNFEASYRIALLPVAAVLWLGALITNYQSNGNASPLPYLPIANPLDLAIIGALFAISAWQSRWHSEIAKLLRIALAATSFIWLNGLLLRTLHHWARVPFDLDAMLRSMLVQASLSLFWTSLALGLMLVATRRHLRHLWLTGGALLVVVVAKLFLIDLANAGTVERIVSFIGVGILLLIIGYFSPVPPKQLEAA